MNESQNAPFSDLPAALVQEILTITQKIGYQLLESFNQLDTARDERRHQLKASNMLRHESDLEFQTPTCCGVDGSYSVERLLALDMTAAAAVAIEGLTPPSETRFWPDPRHLTHVSLEPHSADSGIILRAIMIGMELVLARQAPHDVVLLDGSLTTPTIFFNQALSRIGGEGEIGVTKLNASQQFLGSVEQFFADYHAILEAKRTDKNWVAVPKYTARREVGSQMKWPEVYDDRAMLTDLLEPGEFTQPIALQPPDRPWHIETRPINKAETSQLVSKITQRLSDIRVLYYRPNRNLPALRLEMSRSTAETPGRLAAVIYAIKHQCSSPAILEPFPLYMADRMVKKLSTSIGTFRQVLTQNVAENYQGDITGVFLNLHGYRTESGI